MYLVRRVYLVPGGVPGPRGVYLVLGGVSGPGGVPGQGVYLVLGGVPGPGGHLVPEGGYLVRYSPPVDRHTLVKT